MSKATYFIEVDTYWQNSASFFVGPFDSRDAAGAYIAQPGDNVWLSTSSCGGDIRSAWRVYPQPLSKTEARARGMRDHNELSTRTRLSARSLSAAVRELQEMAY